ncbi:TetR/AcrR family transcriptional regulator [Paratractidigestivibacter faecalis]|uniref:TetR/AcrR family transcriptional regulator n=1 Tax=Paratractidigestivibacter faecalis TaxID=2292441 RepID=UPI003AB5D343
MKKSRELIQKNGWATVNIRSLAAACGVSVGSIYNYFESKSALMSATVESVWEDIFHRPDDVSVFADVLSSVKWMFGRLEYGCERYPGFFTHHSLGFMQQDTEDGKRQMRQAWQHILDELRAVLLRDGKVRPDAFTVDLTPDAFAQALFSLMLSAAVRQDFDSSAVLEIVRRTIY